MTLDPSILHKKLTAVFLPLEAIDAASARQFNNVVREVTVVLRSVKD